MNSFDLNLEPPDSPPPVPHNVLVLIVDDDDDVEIIPRPLNFQRASSSRRTTRRTRVANVESAGPSMLPQRRRASSVNGEGSYRLRFQANPVAPPSPPPPPPPPSPPTPPPPPPPPSPPPPPPSPTPPPPPSPPPPPPPPTPPSPPPPPPPPPPPSPPPPPPRPQPPPQPFVICPICMGEAEDETSTKCGHIFCESCIKTAIAIQAKCPTCRCKVNHRELHRIYLPTTTRIAW